MIQTLSLVRTGQTDPFYNLALEACLFERVSPGECILYLWQNRKTVVIGRNQNCWGECRVDALEREGGTLARRRSGGGAVFHDLGNLNFTFLACDEDYDVDKQLSVVIEAVRRMGIRAEKSGRNDICADGRKFSGNAFLHQSGRSCHHGTILVNADMENMGRFLNASASKMASKGVSSVRARVTNLRNLAPDATVERLSTCMIESFGAVYGLPVRTLLTQTLDAQQLAALRAEFASPAWRFGRAIPFSCELGSRFSWGEVTLQIQANRGEIRAVQVFSDALDTDFITELSGIFQGCAFQSGEMARRVLAMRDPGAPGAEMARDIARMIVDGLESV